MSVAVQPRNRLQTSRETQSTAGVAGGYAAEQKRIHW
jgi:hypothetical protein